MDKETCGTSERCVVVVDESPRFSWLVACLLGCLCPVPRCSFVIRRVVRASSTDALFLCEAPPCVQTVEFRRIDLDVKFGRERVVVVGVVIQLFFLVARRDRIILF